MSNKPLRAPSFASIGLAIGSVAFAQDSDSNINRSAVISPWTITTKAPENKLFMSFGEFYGSYSGRSIEMREGLLGFAPVDSVYLWYAKQSYLAKGRTASSRLDMAADSYGARVMVKRPSFDGDVSIALQAEITRPSDANQRSGNSAQTFRPTKNDSFSVIYGAGRRLDLRAGYSRVEGSKAGKADVADLGLSTEIPTIGNFSATIQGDVVGQSWKDANAGKNHTLEFKPVISVGLGYRFCRWASLQADFAVMTNGVPLAGTRYGALGSYMIYQPGGVAGELQKNALGYGALRLVAGGSF
jgi:hypothetical protein